MSVYERIEKLRKEKGLSQGKLEKELGFSNGSISKWKNSDPTPKRLQKVADYFGVSMPYLLGSSNQAKTVIPSVQLTASDPLQSYLSKLSEFLTASPEHRQLVSDAAHVRAEDIGLACQFLERLADPDSAAPDLPVLDTCNRQKDTNSDTLDTNSDTLDTSADTLDTFNRSQDTSQDTLDTSGDTSRDSDHVELTADTLALVRDTPEVLEAEAEYIKKMSVKPPKRGGTVSPSTEGTSRKSG